MDDELPAPKSSVFYKKKLLFKNKTWNHEIEIDTRDRRCRRKNVAARTASGIDSDANDAAFDVAAVFDIDLDVDRSIKEKKKNKSIYVQVSIGVTVDDDEEETASCCKACTTPCFNFWRLFLIEPQNKWY